MDDPWSADPDDSFKTPRLTGSDGTGHGFNSIDSIIINDTTPTAGTTTAYSGRGQEGHLDDEATPYASSSLAIHRTNSNGSSSGHGSGGEDVRRLASSLPKLNLEAIIDQHHQRVANTHSNTYHTNSSSNSNNEDKDNEPETARPSIISRSGSFSQQSPDLHILASMYKPEETTQLTVADSTGFFENVNLSTPTIEKFESNNRDVWSGRQSSFVRGGGPWDGGNTDSTQSPRRSGIDGRLSKGKKSQNNSGHRKTASDASATSSGASGTNSDSRRASWFGGGGGGAATASAFASASTPSFTHEPDSFHANNIDELENYNPRASSSSSSIADSVGTAGEAPDSDYEDARSKSHSRQGSRRPSISISAGGEYNHNHPGLGGKRLSSFAPIPSLNHTPSQVDLSNGHRQTSMNGNASAGSSTVVSPQTSPPSKTIPQRQSTDQTIHGVTTRRSMSREASSQSATSSASAESNGTGHASSSHSQSQSRTSSSGGGPQHGSLTYSTPMGTSNSQAFEQHRKENEKWLKKNRRTKPSTLDKVISKTRPRDLPPKEKYEDRKHMKEYEDMLAASTQTAKKKAAARAAKQQAREQASNSALSIWEKDILPNWKSVLRRDDLRTVWWNGTMPPRYRSRFWQSCIGNGLVLGKTSYAKALALAKSLENSGKFPQEVLEAIRSDAQLILPQCKLFQAGLPLHNDIVELLQALCVFWKSDKPVHRPGTAWLAGMLLVCMPAQEAFLCLVNLINKSLLKTFYYGSQEDIEAYYRVFNTLLADKMPKVYRNFVAHDIRPSLYLQDWLTTLFSRHLGLETVTRVWDIYVLEGDQFLYRFALGLLQILEARLFNPDHAQLTELCRGEDKGAKVIVAREQNKPEEEVMAWEVYEEMGATEEPIFEVVKAMEWKEATFQRLLTRELPDADA